MSLWHRYSREKIHTAKENDTLKSEIPILVMSVGLLVQKRRIVDQKSAKAMSKLS